MRLTGESWRLYNKVNGPNKDLSGQEIKAAEDGAWELSQHEQHKAKHEKAARGRAENIRRLQEGEKTKILNELNAKGIKVPGMDGLSLEEQLQRLREIKKICDEIEGKYGKWDDKARDEAQKKVDEIGKNLSSKDIEFLGIKFKKGHMEITFATLMMIENLLSFGLGFVPVLGSLYSLISGIILGINGLIPVFEIGWRVIAGAIGLISDIGGIVVTAGSSFIIKLTHKMVELGAKSRGILSSLRSIRANLDLLKMIFTPLDKVLKALDVAKFFIEMILGILSVVFN